MATLRQNLRALWERFKDRNTHSLFEENDLLKHDLKLAEEKSAYYFTELMNSHAEVDYLKSTNLQLKDKLSSAKATLRRIRKRKKAK